MQEPAIVLEGATKLFDDRAVVDDMSFTIQRGQILGLIGPSGCGKTTTVRMVMGVHQPDRGRVLVLGREPRHFDGPLRERLGYMPQHFVLYPELTVRENLDFVASCYGVSIFGRGKRIRKVLELVELTDARNRPAEQISGGMQRRLELACTLIHDPEVIVVDEPTAGVDPVLRRKFWDHFGELRAAGRTILVTTQYVTEAEYCDLIAAQNEGRLVTVGEPEDIRRLAMGGEVVELAAQGLTRAQIAALAHMEPVRRVEQVGADVVRLTVDDAARATPQIAAALKEAGIATTSISEYRPNFDEVFVRLISAQPRREDSPDRTREREQGLAA